MMGTRRLACNEVVDGEHIISLGVVEIGHDDAVVAAYPLDGEQAMTEWLGGRISIELDDNGKRIAVKDKKLLRFSI